MGADLRPTDPGVEHAGRAADELSVATLSASENLVGGPAARR